MSSETNILAWRWRKIVLLCGRPRFSFWFVFNIFLYMYVLCRCAFYILHLGFTVSFSSENLPEFKINMIILYSNKMEIWSLKFERI